MRKPLLLTLALAAILPTQAMAQEPKLAATLTACWTGDAAPQRSLTVLAAMPATAATDRMWMRFELYQKLPGTETIYKRVRLPAWNTWTKSAPDVPSLVFQRTVNLLRAPASYRVTVRFRWYDVSGQRIKSKVKKTKICRQTVAPTVTTPTQ